MNTEQFIKKAKLKHGDKYDYSKVNYIDTHTKVCIICHKHGEFWIAPESHLRGHGCMRCGKAIRYNRKEIFIEKANKLYRNKYDYSKVDYVDYETPVCIICPKHGEFWKSPRLHLKGFACNECSKEEASRKLSMSTEEFIEKAQKIHDNRYDYSKTDLTKRDSEGKVIITCPIHGDFKQTPTSHFTSMGCPKCGIEYRIKSRRSTLDEFKEKVISKYGDKFNFEKTVYVNAVTPLVITCKKHGDITVTPYELLHKYAYGCPECGKEKIEQNHIEKEKIKINTLQKKTDNFIERSRIIHNNKYDYSKVKYINLETPVCIICPIHGEFWQKPVYHLKGSGCSECGKVKTRTKLTRTYEDFLKQAREVHGDKYDYSKVKYKNNSTKVCIICPKHGEFWQTPGMHINEKQGCPSCATQSSMDEFEIYNFIKEHSNYEIIQRDRTILNGKELDIFIPELKIGIEYNGLIWHSELYKEDKFYHLKKTLECEKQGVKLIQIFADEWFYKKEIIKSKLLHLLQYSQGVERICARNCIISEIKANEAKEFLDNNHIQGFHQSSVYLGCFFNSKLIGVMSFMLCNKTKKQWELNRFATDIHKNCVGVGGKLLSYFMKHYEYTEIKSFADRRWSNITDNIYIKLHFDLDQILPPDYSYVPKHTTYKRLHKFNFRKQILNKKYGLPLTMTESEMTKKIDYYKIWNCGLLRYVLKKQNM